MNHRQTQTHKIHHNLDLREVTTFPLIVFFVHGHEGNIQMSFCPWTPKLESQNSLNWDPITLEAHNFVCKPLIEMRFEVKF